jgi:pimeloyl-ACP methyl ester carboxylesterase
VFPQQRILAPALNKELAVYENAKERFGQIRSLEEADTSLRDDCRSFVKDHGKKTDIVVVYFHGYTACSSQGVSFADEYFNVNGYNVIVLLQPYHGKKDMLNLEQGKINPTELAAYVAEALSIASGYGDKIVVQGFSGGGVLAAWAAKYYPEVFAASIISPGFFTRQYPLALRQGIVNLAGILPVQYWWWDDKLKEDVITDDYFYPRYTTKGIYTNYMMSDQLAKEIGTSHGTKHVSMLVNPSDQTINSDTARDYALALSQQDVFSYLTVLPKEKNYQHAFQPMERKEIVSLYSHLLEEVVDRAEEK